MEEKEEGGGEGEELVPLEPGETFAFRAFREIEREGEPLPSILNYVPAMLFCAGPDRDGYSLKINGVEYDFMKRKRDGKPVAIDRKKNNKRYSVIL